MPDFSFLQNAEPSSLAESELRTLASVQQALLQAAVDAIIVIDGRGRIRLFNPAAERLFGYSAEEVSQRNIAMLMPSHHARAHDGYMRDYAAGQAPSIIGKGRDVEGVHKSGRVFPLHLSVGETETPAGKLFVGICHDLTAYRQEQSRADYLVRHDAMTGLLNRKGLADALQNSVQQGAPLYLVLLNFDRFALINESLDHAAGDRLLMVAADRLQQMLAGHDVCARLGADEFALVLHGVSDPALVDAMCLQVQERLSEVVQIDGLSFSLTSSMGVVAAHGADTCHTTLLARAEAALREAKVQGRNQRVFFTEQLMARTRTAAEMEVGLQQAMTHGQLRLVMQPKYHLADARLQGVEVLLRWQHPQWGEISPAHFIPVAETQGLIVELGRWVMEQTCAQIAAWRQRGLKVPQVAINVSAEQLHRVEFVSELQGAMRTWGLQPADIELEITEGAAIKRTSDQVALINELADLGFSLAVDDFGTGFSSLSQLADLPVRTLKIDRAFVQKIDAHTRSEPMIEAVIRLGHSLGLQIVAEGVETLEQVDFLRALNCDVAQGFWYARPLELDKVEQLLVDTSSCQSLVN